MKAALARLLGSAKFWTAIIGLCVTAGASLFARYGIEVSTEAVQQTAGTVALIFSILIGAQGIADHGKSAAEIKAANDNAAPTQVTNVTNVAATPADKTEAA